MSPNPGQNNADVPKPRTKTWCPHSQDKIWTYQSHQKGVGLLMDSSTFLTQELQQMTHIRSVNTASLVLHSTTSKQKKEMTKKCHLGDKYFTEKHLHMHFRCTFIMLPIS
ncbi:unnamed protein product [Candidula unifasciata]|uniref:Uncharacterized protein n=1 Tax=Candidula unifasciata TaxID=100452 RepID=A0A8S3YR37_9EUPU|nr:unnamed protein product [Candidula unifasciata]